MRKIWFLTTLLVCGLLLTGCNRTIINNESWLNNIDIIKQSFTWSLINWKVAESELSETINNIYFDITWDNTLYYLDEFWLCFTLWKEWKWGTIENAYEWKYLASVRIRKKWIKSYWIFIIDNRTYNKLEDYLEDRYIWWNSKYSFLDRLVDNDDTIWNYNLILYEPEIFLE